MIPVYGPDDSSVGDTLVGAGQTQSLGAAEAVQPQTFLYARTDGALFRVIKRQLDIPALPLIEDAVHVNMLIG